MHLLNITGFCIVTLQVKRSPKVDKVDVLGTGSFRIKAKLMIYFKQRLSLKRIKLKKSLVRQIIETV